MNDDLNGPIEDVQCSIRGSLERNVLLCGVLYVAKVQLWGIYEGVTSLYIPKTTQGVNNGLSVKALKAASVIYKHGGRVVDLRPPCLKNYLNIFDDL